MENSFLFVYGSLRPGSGHPMARMLAAAAPCLGPATVTGRLYRVGWYPALGPGSGTVTGEVFGVPAGLWDRLDDFEEARGPFPEYRRRLTPVRLASGLWMDAWTYWYARPLSGLPPVPGGDWLSRGPA